MPSHTYNRYRSSRFRPKKPLMARPVAAVPAEYCREAQAEAAEVYRSMKTGPETAPARRFSFPWFVRKVTALAIIAGIGLFLYAAWTFGYGYYQVRTGQSGLRSLFSITGDGSVDEDYLRREAAALAAGIGYLDPVGEISIPAIDSRWMIVEGADDHALTRGPGHIEETRMPGAGGNFAVAGDRVLYGAPFLHLDEVGAGDEIRVRMPYATFVYRVRESFIVTPDDTSVLEPPGYEAITLLTCDPPWDIKQRIIIRGEFEEVLPAGA